MEGIFVGESQDIRIKANVIRGFTHPRALPALGGGGIVLTGIGVQAFISLSHNRVTGNTTGLFIVTRVGRRQPHAAFCG
jgi:hypothetical protein